MKVGEVGKRNYRSLWTALGGTGKLRGNEFALFRRTLENCAVDRSSNDGGVELRFGEVSAALGFGKVAMPTIDLFLAWTEFRELISLLQRVDALLAGFELGGSVVESLPGKDALRNQILGAV